MTNLDLGVYNISLVNCNKIFERYASDAIVDDFYKFDILEKSLNNTLCKRIFYHYTIYNFCEAILKNRSKNKSILFFNNTQLNDSSLAKYFSEEDIIKNIEYVLNKMKKILPVKVYVSRYSLPYFDHLLSSRQGRGQMLLNDIQKNTDKEYARFTFSKAKQFTKRYELTWLNQEYFNQLSTKFLLIK